MYSNLIKSMKVNNPFHSVFFGCNHLPITYQTPRSTGCDHCILSMFRIPRFQQKAVCCKRLMTRNNSRYDMVFADAGTYIESNLSPLFQSAGVPVYVAYEIKHVSYFPSRYSIIERILVFPNFFSSNKSLSPVMR